MVTSLNIILYKKGQKLSIKSLRLEKKYNYVIRSIFIQCC